MWTDQYKQRTYLTITAHWIAPDFTLKSRVVCTDEFDSAQKKTGINVKACLLASLSTFGISTDDLEFCVFTTDRGSNMILALQNEDRIDCIAHVLNTVLRHTFDKDCPKPITELINSAKSLVRYIKKGSLQNLLATSVKQSCVTRWNSTYFMLKSIQDVYANIQVVFAEHALKEMRRVTAIDLEPLKEVVSWRISTLLRLSWRATLPQHSTLSSPG